jgi:hypothetical protein
VFGQTKGGVGEHLLGEGGTGLEGGRTRGCVWLCRARGGNTENNNKVKLHKDQIWVSAGRIIDKAACRQDNVCAFSPQTGVNYHRTDTEKTRRGRLADTHNSFAL